MARLFSTTQIAERALRMMGEFPISESAPDGESLREALTWLELNMAELVGTERLFNRVPATIDLAITNGTQEYDLYTALGSALPDDRIQFIVEAWIEDGDENRYELTIVNRHKFEDVSKQTTNGRPVWLHVLEDRQAPIIRVFPTPDADDTTEWTLKLVVQLLSPNIAPSGVTGSVAGSALHGISHAWQRWLVYQLAHDLGNGAIRKLPEQSLARWEKMAVGAKARLLAFLNREHSSDSPTCDPAWAFE